MVLASAPGCGPRGFAPEHSCLPRCTHKLPARRAHTPSLAGSPQFEPSQLHSVPCRSGVQCLRGEACVGLSRIALWRMYAGLPEEWMDSPHAMPGLRLRLKAEDKVELKPGLWNGFLANSVNPCSWVATSCICVRGHQGRRHLLQAPRYSLGIPNWRRDVVGHVAGPVLLGKGLFCNRPPWFSDCGLSTALYREVWPLACSWLPCSF